MKYKSKKALILAALASISVLSGCNKAKIIQIDGETYIQSGEEYNKIEMKPKIFEPGTHIIHYIKTLNNGSAVRQKNIDDGYDSLYFTDVVVPDGYKLSAVTSYSSQDGYDEYIIYIFVNDKTVEVEPSYNTRTNEVMYTSVGNVIEDEMKLER